MVDHRILLRGLNNGDGPLAPPVLVDRAAANLIPDITRDLGSDAGRRAVLGGQISCSAAHPGTLSHPTQRSVVVLLAEAACDSLMNPRLDPATIDSAGLVVRRVWRDPHSGAHHQDVEEAWMSDRSGSRGWYRLTSRDADLDPDPARRKGLGSGIAHLDDLYAQTFAPTPRTEKSEHLFVAAPALCSALRKTLLFGVVPTTDLEKENAPVLDPLKDSDVRQMIPVLLRAGDHAVPEAGAVIGARYGSSDWLAQNPHPQFKQFLALVQTAVTQYGCFDNTPEGNAVKDCLDQIATTDASGKSRTLTDLLQQADAVLLGAGSDADPNATFTMPRSWSPISDELAQRIFLAARAALAANVALFSPGVGRFDQPGRQYKIRAFVRAKCEPQCPPRLVWSDRTGPCNLAPWYEPGNQPPVHVALPDPTDRDLLKRLAKKPNVTFAVPAGLQQMMQGSSLQGMMSGAGGGGGGIGIDWICAFSLPIITICAFFVLNIFLSLLNIVFFWMAFIKICIPVPVKK